MTNRVTAAEVREIIDVSEDLSLNAFIIAGNALVTAKLSGSGLDEDLLKEIERWTAAHFVAIRDPRVRERSLGDAKEKYALSGGYSGGLDATPYGQQAMVLDTTGILASTMGKRAAEVEAVQEDYL